MLRSIVSSRLASSLRTRGHQAVRTLSTETSRAPVQLPISLYGEQATYANALYKTATRQNTLETVDADLNKFNSLVKDNASLQTYLANPIISKKDKSTDVTAISKKLGLSKTTTAFLGVVAENGRLQEIVAIIGKFGELMKAKHGYVDATVRTAKALSKKETSALEKAVKSGFIKPGEQLRITYETDQSILGGLQLQIGDKFLDLSVQTQIKKLGSALADTK